MKQLILTQDQVSESKFVYLVVKVTNSTKPKIGERISEELAGRYCTNPKWNVVIKGFSQ